MRRDEDKTPGRRPAGVRTLKGGRRQMLKCRNCGNEWQEVIPKPTPPKHCPKCGAPEVIRTAPPKT